MKIVVPIHPEALRVAPSTNQVGKTALYDFDLLGSEPASSLGSMIASNQFEKAQTSLNREPGIHLHWSLPRAYTRGAQDPATGALRYPVVPNRWLVIRTLKDNTKSTDNTAIRLWVIESDAHTPKGQGTTTKTAIPWMDDVSDLQGIQTNLLGRKLDLGQNWTEPRSTGNLGITSVMAGAAEGDVGFLGEVFQSVYGYGETFTAYYPNCGDVLGIWDSLDDYFPKPNALEVETDFTVSYMVAGWVNAVSADVCNAVLTQAVADWKKEPDPKPDFAAYLQGVVENNLGWSLSSYDTLNETTAPETSAVVAGLVSDITWKIASPGHPTYPTALPSTDKIQVAIGNNTAEALSAYINAVEAAKPGGMGTTSGGVDSSLEWLLNALQFGKLQSLSGGDIGVGQLQEYLHSTAFAGFPGGYTWQARQKQNAATPAQGGSASAAGNNEITLPPYLAKVLADLNALQRQLDRSRDDIASRRKQLFLDWTRHISAINTHVIKNDQPLSQDTSGTMMADGLLQLYPGLRDAGSYVGYTTPLAPYDPKADPFSILVPPDFPQQSATKLADYAFNTVSNATAAEFVAALLQFGVTTDGVSDANLPDADASLRLAARMLALFAAGGSDADTYLTDAKTALEAAKAQLGQAQNALAALRDTSKGLSARQSVAEAASTTLKSFIDPASGVFATYLKYTADPGKAPLAPSETYTGAIQPPFGALMSWDQPVGGFPGMKGQIDVFAGQNGAPQPLLDTQQAAINLAEAYFYATSGLTFKTSSAYYLQMAETNVAAAASDATKISDGLAAAIEALADQTLSGMTADLAQIAGTILPRIEADLAQAQPDLAAAIEELDALLTPEAPGAPSLPGLREAADSESWSTLTRSMDTAARTVAARLPAAEQVAIWNQFLVAEIGHLFDLQATPADQFFAPAEPVILLAEATDDADGALKPFNRNGGADRLPCRLDAEIVRVDGTKVSFPSPIADLASRLDPKITGLADTLQALAQEAVLLTPEFSTAVTPADLKKAALANRDVQHDRFHNVVLNAPPTGLKGKLPYYIAYTWRQDNDPFLPLFIWWNANYRFSQEYTNASQSFPATFLDQFQLGSYDVELQPTKAAIGKFSGGPTVTNDFDVHGLISLSSASTVSLCSQIQIYCQSNLDYDPANGPPPPDLPGFEQAKALYDAYTEYKTLNVLSQALSGFNPALMQRAQELQIPITIPKTWTETGGSNIPLSQFWPTSFLFGQSSDWPISWNDAGINSNSFASGQSQSWFSPMRAGFLEMGTITLVDAFGRFVDLPKPNPEVISDKMTSDQPPPDAHHTYLAPRLVQPTRVNMDWLAAADSAGFESFAEPGDAAAASPVCGWVWPNHLDNALMLYDADGRPLGSLRLRVSTLHWFPVPGETTDPTKANRDEMLAWFETQRANPVFSAFVADFLYPEASSANSVKFGNMLRVLQKAQQFVVTPTMQQDQSLATLMGQPLVVTQASVSLRQKGLPDVGLNALTYPEWNASGLQFTVSASDYIPYDLGNFNQGDISALKVPVRIGTALLKPAQGDPIPYFDDGVAGYFLNGDWSTIFTPADVPDSAGITSVFAPGAHPLSLTPGGDSAIVTCLMDPRAAVHATTGILPVKALAIPPDLYARVLEQLEITFLTAPILVAEDPPQIPLPTEREYDWSWVEVGSEAVPLTPSQKAGTAILPETPQKLVDGWLKLSRRT